MSDELRRKSYVRVGDELYPEGPLPTWHSRLTRSREMAPQLLALVKAALANPESWVEWQREAIAVVDFIEKGGK